MTEDIERVRKLRDDMATSLRAQQQRLDGVQMALDLLEAAERERERNRENEASK